MIHIHLLLLLLALIAPPDPHLTAYWVGPGAAELTWTQTARGCLAVEHATGERAFIGCYEAPGEYAISLGRVGPLSGDLRPTAGDIFTLWTPNGVYRAPLVGRAQYLPAFRA